LRPGRKKGNPDGTPAADTIGWALWKRMLEQRKEDESIVARLAEDKVGCPVPCVQAAHAVGQALLVLPALPIPSAEATVDLKQHVYYGTVPREAPNVFFGEVVYGPVELVGEGGAKAALINDYVIFTPAPTPPNPDDPHPAGPPLKRNVQMVVPV